MAYAQDATPPGRRLVALRTVPTASQYSSPESLACLGPPAAGTSFVEPLSNCGYIAYIAACTLVLGGAAILAAWLMPAFYISEARVLVGVQSPRLPNVESNTADFGSNRAFRTTMQERA